MNFTSVLDAARDTGLEARGPVSRRGFSWRSGSWIAWGSRGNSFNLDEYRDRRAIQDLFLPGGLGESHRVLVMGTPDLEMSLSGAEDPRRCGAPPPDKIPGGPDPLREREGMEREVLEVDVLFVGAGPACLAGAYHLASLIQAHNQTVAAGAERPLGGQHRRDREGPDIGAHGISGAVLDPMRSGS